MLSDHRVTAEFVDHRRPRSLGILLGIGASKSGEYQNAPALLPGSSQLRKAFFLIGLAQGEKRCALAAPSNAVPNTMLTRYMMRPPAARLPR